MTFIFEDGEAETISHESGDEAEAFCVSSSSRLDRCAVSSPLTTARRTISLPFTLLSISIGHINTKEIFQYIESNEESDSETQSDDRDVS